MEALICPKCKSTMRSYERSGVTVDQCSNCQGIFLDRGELERLAQAEDTHYAGGGYGGGGPQVGGQQGSGGGFLNSLLMGGHGRKRGHH